MQAFLAIGIWQYLFADEGLMIEAGEHFINRDPRLKVPPPLKIEGINEPKGHWNHIHFEIWRKPTLEKGLGGFTWIAPTDDLMSTLYELAIIRDQDPDFWKLMTGLMDEDGYGVVPTSLQDFDRVRTGYMPMHASDQEIANWKTWWQRPQRDDDGKVILPEQNKLGIRLLPVWSSKLATKTRSYDVCKSKIIPEDTWATSDRPV